MNIVGLSAITAEYIQHCGSDNMVVKAARVSMSKDEVNIKPDETQLIKDLVAKKHLTPFEMCDITFLVSCPIFVVRQFHRHRTFCVSGDTEVYTDPPSSVRTDRRRLHKIPIERLYYSLFNDITKIHLRTYDVKRNTFDWTHIKKVFQNGMKHMYRITLADGKTITCTKEHRFLGKNGFETLEDTIGLIHINKSVGMTKRGIIKVNGQYLKGQIPWNKGVKGYKINNTISDEQREAIRNARSGKKSNFWKGGVSSERQLIATWTTNQTTAVHKKFNYICQKCGKKGGKLHAHHIKSVVEFPKLAKDFNNLESICVSCHKIEHKQNGDALKWRNSHNGNLLIPREVEIIKIEYVGIKESYDLEVEHEDHNYIANGIIVHNSYNEWSATYSTVGESFYVPKEIRLEDSNVKAQSTFSDEKSKELLGLIEYECYKSTEGYCKLISNGVSLEMARMILPQNMMTKFYAKGNIRNWVQYCAIRCNKRVLYEHQVLAKQIFKEILKMFPISVWALAKDMFDEETFKSLNLKRK